MSTRLRLNRSAPFSRQTWCWSYSTRRARSPAHGGMRLRGGSGRPGRRGARTSRGSRDSRRQRVRSTCRPAPSGGGGGSWTHSDNTSPRVSFCPSCLLGRPVKPTVDVPPSRRAASTQSVRPSCRVATSTPPTPALTVAFAFGATRAGPTSSDESSTTSGRRMRSQYVQFQPALASAGVHTWVRWPPKKTSPRAPLTIAWSAMNRACCERRKAWHHGGPLLRADDARSTRSATSSRTASARRPLAITRAQSPTTETPLFAAPPCTPGGYDTG